MLPSSWSSWRPEQPLASGMTLPAPNPLDFVRVAGTPGTYRVRVGFERLVAE